MKVQVARTAPWRPEDARLALRGAVVVRVRPGEDPEHIPNHHDTVLGAGTAATRVDGGSIDRAIRRFSPAARVTRVFHAARSLADIGKQHRGWDDVEHALGLSRTFRIHVDPEASVLGLVDALADLANVEQASPCYLCQAPFAAAAAGHPAEPDPGYGHALIRSAEALEMEAGDTALIVGVVDSGAALSHPELSGRLRPGYDTVDLPGEQVSRGMKLIGDTRGRDRDPMDNMGHGTACAGIIGANGRHVPRGVAGAARVLPIRALTAAVMVDRGTRTAVGSIPDIDAGVKAAVDLGARVLNLSFGTPESALRENDPVPHADVVRYALAREATLVAASGNGGDTTRYFPAALPGVIAVGSVGPSRRPSPFTSRGPHVAISAPGEQIPVVALSGYERNSGTSFASPFVAAACALMVARAARRSSSLSADTIRDLLVKSASPFASGADARGCGGGVLDVTAALAAVDEALRAEDTEQDSAQAHAGA